MIIVVLLNANSLTVWVDMLLLFSVDNATCLQLEYCPHFFGGSGQFHNRVFRKPSFKIIIYVTPKDPWPFLGQFFYGYDRVRSLKDKSGNHIVSRHKDHLMFAQRLLDG